MLYRPNAFPGDHTAVVHGSQQQVQHRRRQRVMTERHAVTQNTRTHTIRPLYDDYFSGERQLLVQTSWQINSISSCVHISPTNHKIFTACQYKCFPDYFNKWIVFWHNSRAVTTLDCTAMKAANQ